MLLRASSLWSGSSNAAPIGGALRARPMRALFLSRGPARPGSEGRPGVPHGLCDYARYRFPLERRPVDLQHQPGAPGLAVFETWERPLLHAAKSTTKHIVHDILNIQG